MNAQQLFLNMFFMCHRLPERSFFYKGKQFPLCARCTGLAIGYTASFILLIIFGLLPIWLTIMLIVPMLIDGVGQLFHRWESNNWRRVITGSLAGVGILYVFFHIGHHAYNLGQTVGMKLLQ